MSEKENIPGLLSVSRFRCLGAMIAAYLILGAVTRVVLMVGFPSDFQGNLLNTVAMFLRGFCNDLAAGFFVLALPAFLFLLPSGRFFTRRGGRIYAATCLFLFVAVLLFGMAAEYCFWDEFHTRFNFIAVDYLIYTTEVIRNIVESYPLVKVLGGIGLGALGLTALMWRYVAGTGRPRLGLRLPARLGLFGLYAGAAAMVFLFFSPLGAGANRGYAEGGYNGPYELFSAFWNNSLNYHAFYPIMDKDEAFRILKADLAESDSAFISPVPEDVRREMLPTRPAIRPNVILVVMESAGLDRLGEETPNLVRLSHEGLFFANMRSTGTRTVRGLEAIILSLPPTPGNSIVRRPNNSGLFSMGSVFREKGYDRTFIYGGYGYFDNMNDFFAGNGYKIVDKTDFSKACKTFASAWGQCDEDLFGEVLDQADASYAAGRPFHQVVLTTSNHRPYTYPAGRVSIPSGNSRQGAVEYSDYAIGRFIKEASVKPWFDNTVFIFVGDHPEAVAGKTYVPAGGYGIVSIIYAPKLIQPQKVDTLCSQVDLGPTLFSLLGWEYRSQFFGRNILTMRPEEGRAWISTYQLLGFLDAHGLTVLQPTAEANGKPHQAKEPSGPDGRRYLRAVASYQCAYDLYSRGELKESVVMRNTPKVKALARLNGNLLPAGPGENPQLAKATE